MTHPARPQIALAKNSKRSSRRNRLVARGSELFAVSQESHILPCADSLNSPVAARRDHFNIYLRILLSSASSTH